ncbi:MAG: hypothetical protein F4X52_08770 [Acidimicrobiaceae bacterium]|nr:hypothetical protein [Acidimicrobiaceae bacterium]
MAATMHFELPQDPDSIIWRANTSEPFEWDCPDDADGETLAEIDASTGVVPIPPGGTLHESTAGFLKSLEDRI